MPSNGRRRLRQFILQAFDDEGLMNLCHDYFPQVYNEFTTGMLKGAKVRLLVDSADRGGRLDDLHAALKRENRQAYDNAFPEEDPLPAEPQPRRPIVRNPRQIFISHASADAEFAHWLAGKLRDKGWQTWIAPDSIRPGEKWGEAIDRGLLECGVFVLVVSEAAVNSNWVRKETYAAIDMETRGELRYMPLALAAVELPPTWQSNQWIAPELDDEAKLAALLRTLDPQAFATPNPTAENSTVNKARVVVSSEPETEPHEKQIDSFIHPITGKEMVRVPAGKFLYGDDKETVYLDEFWIDKTPVTNAEYKRFLDANPGYRVPRSDRGLLDRLILDRKYEWDERSRTYPKDKADHPVVLVSWHDAQAYAKWAGAQLPAEEQWEKAARGVDGWRYPWGDEWRSYHCNTKEVGIGGTSSVGQFSPQGDSPYGCVDMAGNVWEWTATWYNTSQTRRVLRGGSWNVNRYFARASFRSYLTPDGRVFNAGFRVVVRLSPSHPDP